MKVLWLGGECNGIIKPGMADWGVNQKAFFTDLNTQPNSEEYSLAGTVLGQRPHSAVAGRFFALDAVVCMCSKLRRYPGCDFRSRKHSSGYTPFRGRSGGPRTGCRATKRGRRGCGGMAVMAE